MALRLTSRDPGAPFAMVKWDHEAAAWAPLAFKETMITHLDLPSRCRRDGSRNCSQETRKF